MRSLRGNGGPQSKSQNTNVSTSLPGLGCCSRCDAEPATNDRGMAASLSDVADNSAFSRLSNNDPRVSMVELRDVDMAREYQAQARTARVAESRSLYQHGYECINDKCRCALVDEVPAHDSEP